MSRVHSRSVSGSSGDPATCDLLETGAARPQHEGLKLRSRSSCNDLLLAAAGLSNDRDFHHCRPKVAALQAGGALPPLPLPPRASHLLQAVRCSWRRVLSALLALTLWLLLLLRHRQLYRTGQNVAAALYYAPWLDPMLLGRSEARCPAPHCCLDEGCAAPRSRLPGSAAGRVAVVTYLRDDAYLPLLQQLECTLRRSNPGVELGLMWVQGELSEASLELLHSLNITLLPVEPLDFANTFERRYGRNWLKVRALGLTQYHSVLLVDSDVAVVGPVAPLFGLPVEFAAVWDQSKWLNRFKTAVQGINGGVLLLRPCPAVERHMLSLLQQHPKLRFVHSTAEQAFFSWYYRYTGATLPLHWNCQSEQCLVGSRTVGGSAPRIVHYTRNKPFHGPLPGSPGHQYLCSKDELSRRPALGSGAIGSEMLAPGSPAAAAEVATVETGAVEAAPQAAAGLGAVGAEGRAVQQQSHAVAAEAEVEAEAEGDGRQVQRGGSMPAPHALLKHNAILQQGGKELP